MTFRLATSEAVSANSARKRISISKAAITISRKNWLSHKPNELVFPEM